MEEPLEPLRLTRNESAVLGELGRLELGIPEQRLTRTYRRILELSHSDEPLDGLLAAHLVRDFLVAFTAQTTGDELPRERIEYRQRVERLAISWSPGVRDDVPDDATLDEIRRLLNDHDAASERAGDVARSAFQRGDRVDAGYVPRHSIERWRSLSARAAGFAHRIKNVQEPLPTAAEGRRIVDEFTATLLAAIGPFLVAVDEVDRLLALDSPDQDAANRVADLLRTPAQVAYFFDRAGPQWLQPLVSIGSILTSIPPIVDVGGGYVQAPLWPQGRYLERVASDDPDLVLGQLGRIRHPDNPQVVTGVVRVARLLPTGHARQLTDQIVGWMRVPLALDYAAIETAGLATDLAIAGLAQEATLLLVAVVTAAVASERDSDWLLEQSLGDPVETITIAGGDLTPALRTLLDGLLERQGSVRRYSTLWLTRMDRQPQYGARREWHLANALYRVLLAGNVASAKASATSFLRDGEHVFARIALAAIAERPELVGASDSLLLDAEKWDDSGATRDEFRRALRPLWLAASDDSRQALLEYALAAREPAEIAVRLAADGGTDVPTPEQLRQGWRSRLLYPILDLIPPEWNDRLGPLEAIEYEGIPEPTADWVRHESPASEDDLATMGPAEVLSLVREWEPTAPHTLRGPSMEGLASTSSGVIASRAAEFEPFGRDIAELEPRVVSAVMSSLLRGLREGGIEDKSAAFRLSIHIGEAFIARAEMDPSITGPWPRQVRHDLAGAVEKGSNERLLREIDADRVIAVLRTLLADDDPTPESEQRDVGGGYDVAMLALNSVRGEATTAGIELLLEAAGSDWKTIADEMALVLRQQVARDRSLSVRGAVGLRLPWLLARDEAHVADWISILFGDDVPRHLQRATWDTYLTYSRFFRDTAVLLVDQYEIAIAELPERDDEVRTSRRDPDEMLGIHVALAHLLGLPVESAGGWLARFYLHATDEIRGRVTRWTAQQAADPDAELAVRDRARAFLRERARLMTVDDNEAELKAVGWIGRTTDRPTDVLETVVLPALERTGGATENEPGLADLVARCATDAPLASAKTLELLVRGDRWRAIAHVAGAEVRAALEVLREGDPETRTVVGRIVNLLSEHGFLEFRDLLPEDPSSH